MKPSVNERHRDVFMARQACLYGLKILYIQSAAARVSGTSSLMGSGLTLTLVVGRPCCGTPMAYCSHVCQH